ncbi:hypothetical protein [Cupriavidus oxalaticus]|uniref:Uncharacterized protein n=1 Tax=Cupriavidus oxalaticus TaxID=96344 RepID=A0A5P3VFQ8_9BURK|nr:hypothetical protein [Cupriavidus oxalaticus]QEZ44725.1 hypothetical protein D2917_11085 [Cupriavidus oxalaticus]
MEATERKFDPEQIYNVNGSWLNLIEQQQRQIKALEKQVRNVRARANAASTFAIVLMKTVEIRHGIHLDTLQKVVGVEFDKYARAYAAAYADAFADAMNAEKSGEECEAIADAAGLAARAAAIAKDNRPRLSRAGVVGDTVDLS